MSGIVIPSSWDFCEDSTLKSRVICAVIGGHTEEHDRQAQFRSLLQLQ